MQSLNMTTFAESPLRPPQSPIGGESHPSGTNPKELINGYPKNMNVKEVAQLMLKAKKNRKQAYNAMLKSNAYPKFTKAMKLRERKMYTNAINTLLKQNQNKYGPRIANTAKMNLKEYKNKTTKPRWFEFRKKKPAAILKAQRFKALPFSKSGFHALIKYTSNLQEQLSKTKEEQNKLCDNMSIYHKNLTNVTQQATTNQKYIWTLFGQTHQLRQNVALLLGPSRARNRILRGGLNAFKKTANNSKQKKHFKSLTNEAQKKFENKFPRPKKLKYPFKHWRNRSRVVREELKGGEMKSLTPSSPLPSNSQPKNEYQTTSTPSQSNTRQSPTSNPSTPNLSGNSNSSKQQEGSPAQQRSQNATQ